jgi:hypothetical protein
MATYRYGVVRSRIAASQLVMSRSAVRVRSSALFFACKTAKNKSPRHEHRGLCQQYVSSN